MTEFLLLLSLWPFHHKKPEVTTPAFGGPEIVIEDCTKAICASKSDAYWEAYFDAERQRISDADCTKQDGLYYYVAEDGVIAFSHAGCDAAKSNSKIARTLNRVEMIKI